MLAITIGRAVVARLYIDGLMRAEARAPLFNGGRHVKTALDCTACRYPEYTDGGSRERDTTSCSAIRPFGHLQRVLRGRIVSSKHHCPQPICLVSRPGIRDTNHPCYRWPSG